MAGGGGGEWVRPSVFQVNGTGGRRRPTQGRVVVVGAGAEGVGSAEAWGCLERRGGGEDWRRWGKSAIGAEGKGEEGREKRKEIETETRKRAPAKTRINQT